MLSEKELKTKSKLLSLVLRHRPELIGIDLDRQGWTSVDVLLEKLAAFGKPLALETLKDIVENNNKKRFAFNEDQSKIRAAQGHSVEIDLGYKAVAPPEFLYHGTAKKYLNSILREGIKKRGRHQVHLSSDVETAHAVGSRHGSPVILKIQSAVMAASGISFYLSENKVWLTDYIAPQYILQE